MVCPLIGQPTSRVQISCQNGFMEKLPRVLKSFFALFTVFGPNKGKINDENGKKVNEGQ